MKINVSDLENIIHQLLLRLKEKNGDNIEVSNDFYWDISSRELYNPYETPKNLSLGQLSDDWDQILRLKTKDDAIIYDLIRIANILRVLGIENELV